MPKCQKMSKFMIYLYCVIYKKNEDVIIMTEYKVGSLFAGVGGICLGFKNAKTIK